MDKNSFYFEASPYGSGEYIAEIEGYKIEISEAVFSEEKIAFAKALLESIVEKLHQPIIRIDEIGGRFTYCHHELDSDHLIDVEFVGLMDSFFSVNIDG